MVKTVLFLCTDNAVLSPLAEAYVNATGDGGLRAFSAGLTPADHLSGAVPEVLAENGIDNSGLAPKSWEVFAMTHAPRPDLIVALDSGFVQAIAHAWPKWIPRQTWRVTARTCAGAGKSVVRDAFREIRASVNTALQTGDLPATYMALRRSA